MIGWQCHQLNHVQAICTSLQKITTPTTPHQSDFYRAGCPSWHPTNSIKVLKAYITHMQLCTIYISFVFHLQVLQFHVVLLSPSFLPCELCAVRYMLWLCVCLFVCLCVCYQSRTAVFWCQKSFQTSNGVTPSGGTKCRWGRSMLANFDK